MNQRKIVPIAKDRINEYTDCYFGAYTAFKDMTEAGRESKKELLLYSMDNDKSVHFFGLEEDGKIIATMRIVDYEINIFGQMKKAAGLASLAVHHLHKKQHAAFDMVKFFDDYAKENCDIALLLPFNMAFYKKMGYGFQSRIMEHNVPTASLPAHDDISHLVLLNDSDLNDILNCQREFVLQNHGQLVKFEDDIRNISANGETRWIGYRDHGKLKGYMSIDFTCDSDTNYTLNCMNVTEMAYLDSEIFRELIGYLKLQSDQAQRTVLITGEPDFISIFSDAADVSGYYIHYGGIQTNTVALNVMHKIPDPARFVQDTAYRKFPSGNLNVRFDYYDEMLHEDHSLTIDISNQKWHLTESSPDVTVTCCLADLTSIFMGSAEVAALSRLGVIKVSEELKLTELDTLFHVPQKPYSNSDF